jgi:hypothetical protein
MENKKIMVRTQACNDDKRNTKTVTRMFGRKNPDSEEKK